MPKYSARFRGPRRDSPLAPTLLSRVGAAVRPDWARTDTARRITAGVLIVAAGVLLVRDGLRDAGTPVLVAARDLAPGSILTPDDVRAVDRPDPDLPDGSVRIVGDVSGRTVASPVRAGEVLTDVRLLGPRLTEAAAGSPDARMVPVRLTDPGLSELIRAGDRVDVLTVDQSSGTDEIRRPIPTVLATDATVVLVAPEASGGGRRDRVVMLALPAPAAGAVATASLTDALTVTLR
ncbi:SAF domain-containing protein [Rhodococcus sp. PAM 2766]|uniref:SAF domain-containing protein n=1 Tax=Rhodococcus parequi TaxID=3137122 RepID=A0ABW9FCY9_9NOCA